jgi:transposase
MTKLSDKIHALHAEGKSYTQIKEELDCSKGTVAYYLGDGQREKTRKRTRDLRNKVVKYIQEYKQGQLCTDCRENYPYWVLEFDHLGDKSFNVSHFRSVTTDLEKIKEEVAKCEVVCSNCHKNRTHFRKTTSGNSALNISEFYE